MSDRVREAVTTGQALSPCRPIAVRYNASTTSFYADSRFPELHFNPKDRKDGVS